MKKRYIICAAIGLFILSVVLIFFLWRSGNDQSPYESTRSEEYTTELKSIPKEEKTESESKEEKDILEGYSFLHFGYIYYLPEDEKPFQRKLVSFMQKNRIDGKKIRALRKVIDDGRSDSKASFYLQVENDNLSLIQVDYLKDEDRFVFSKCEDSMADIEDYGGIKNTSEEERKYLSTESIYSGEDEDVVDPGEVLIERIGFKIENTFDVSQTSGKPLPAICHNLEGDVKRYDQFMQAVRKVSKVPIEFAPLTGKDGFYSLVEKKIVLRDDMSQKQTMSAVIHELSHSVLHDLDMENLEQSIKERNRDTRTMEVEADAISAVVNYYFENEVGDNNFGYIASWSKDKELPELYASLQVIRDTASAFIDDISKELTKIRLQEIQNDPFLSTGDNRFALYQLDENTEEIHYRFKNTAYMERNDIHVRTGDYRQVYSGELTEEMTLDSIYEQFNMDHPSDFHGHSLSISDVIATRMDGVERAFYVDNFGFKELPNFIEHLRSPEMVLPERRMEKTGDISKEFANYGQNRNKEKENTPDKMKQAGKTVSKQVPSAYGIKI